MGSITSSIGLISGIDTATLIEQLLAIEARPVVLAQNRIVQLQQRQAAFLDLNSSLLSLNSAAESIRTSNAFDASSASSTNSEVLSGTASNGAAEGSYTFRVDRLVTTQQLLSRGFADSDTAGLGGESITFETGGGSLATETRLSDLNGGAGVRRGEIVVTDSTGNTATIDLSTALNVDDVLDAINSAGGVGVNARVDGRGLVLEDTAGGVGSLTVASAFGDSTAEDLGIAGTDASGTITGQNIKFLTGSTSLNTLNDGNGVFIRDGFGTPDLTITDRSGNSVQINLGRITEMVDDPDSDDPDDMIEQVVQTRATSLQDVVDYINAQAAAAATPVQVTARINDDGTGLELDDSSIGLGGLTVRSSGGRTTARDMGIETDSFGVAANTLSGTDLIAGINSTLVNRLNGGAGIGNGGGPVFVNLTDRAGNSTSINLQSVENGSTSELIDAFNAQASAGGVGLSLELNASGSGFTVRDTTTGTGSFEVSGVAAEALGFATAGTSDSTFEGNSAQLQWINDSTLVSSLRNGSGIGTGTIRITDASGVTEEINITTSQGNVRELVDQLNSRPDLNINARINDQGDGIIIEDTSGVAGTLTIEDVSGTVARNLNIRGSADVTVADGGPIDGSYERTIDLDIGDTLEDIQRKINEASVGVTASIINDGSGANPFRLSFTARDSGVEGRTLVQARGLDLGLTTLSEGDDAVVFFGSADVADAVLLTSSTNTLDGVVEGVSINLSATSDEPVTLNVTRDTGATEAAVQGFVDAFNGVIETINRYDFFDSENERRGVLLGDTTSGQIRRQLLATVQGTPLGVEGGQFTRLFQAGVTLGSGSVLEFDAAAFREALAQDPEGVEALFSANRLAPIEDEEVAPGVFVSQTDTSFNQLGVVERLAQLADGFTNSIDGLITNRNNAIDSQIDLQERRIDQLNDRINDRRTILEAEFVAMERALAQLQTQQSALSSISFAG